MSTKQRLDAQDRTVLLRWRLLLGKSAVQQGIGRDPSGETEQLEAALAFVYGDSSAGGTEGTQLTVPHWIDQVDELFPRAAKELLERELIKRRGIAELLDKPEVLERVEPNVELVKTLLTHKDLLNPKARILARKIIDKVVSELKRKLEVQIEQAVIGALRKDRHSPRRVFRNLDLKTTLRRNLQNWDEQRGRLLVDQVYFHAAERNKRPWHVIVCVDQSGSMLESAVFSAVMASIFAELPAMRTSLVLFDTSIVDLSDQVGSPVDVLLKVQLGGGTNITQALRYCQQLVREPDRTILVLITDFYEGADERELVRAVAELHDAGVRMVGLGALGYETQPELNRGCANKCRKVGMDVLVCTPEHLAELMGQIISGRRRSRKARA